jgi:hypothetical protein
MAGANSSDPVRVNAFCTMNAPDYQRYLTSQQWR